ncbi:dimethylargininase [Propionicicella superfundia]|uniref:dimethylargininase n=1 Tax=Propionicicella superfundia TaxID=348582 RepID=UPI0004175767|nr:dimethylargininase [Propionicicella superfundia]
MTLVDIPSAAPAGSAAGDPARLAAPKRVLMCRPEHFTVSYRINPWMHPTQPTDTARALRQWTDLRETYRRLGIDVELVAPRPGLPDMVYAANGGFVLDGVALGPRFRHVERASEAPAYMGWFAERGLRVVEPTSYNEGEGDYLLVGDTIFAGTGFRSDRASHAQLGRVFGREVVSLRLVDPRFYHLDTAFAVLDSAGGPRSVAYLPQAFDRASRRILADRFPDALTVSEADATVLGLNCFSDGRNVVVAAQATGFARDLAAAGYVAHPVDLSELLRGGGGVKCCTLELRW